MFAAFDDLLASWRFTSSIKHAEPEHKIAEEKPVELPKLVTVTYTESAPSDPIDEREIAIAVGVVKGVLAATSFGVAKVLSTKTPRVMLPLAAAGVYNIWNWSIYQYLIHNTVE